MTYVAGTGPVITCTSLSSATVFRGLHITGFQVLNWLTSVKAAGLLLLDSSPMVVNCVFKDQMTDYRGCLPLRRISATSGSKLRSASTLSRSKLPFGRTPDPISQLSRQDAVTL